MTLQEKKELLKFCRRWEFRNNRKLSKEFLLVFTEMNPCWLGRSEEKQQLVKMPIS